MANRCLVAYASKYGATAEIAEKIGEMLRLASIEVDVLPAKNVKDPRPYKAVVLGSAAYMFHWRAEATSFLRKNQDRLAERPTWLFSSGPLGKGDPVELLKGQRFPKALQPVIDRIQPRDVAVFHGCINMQKLNPFERFAFKKSNLRGDFRDWGAITSWANNIAAELKKQG